MSQTFVRYPTLDDFCEDLKDNVSFDYSSRRSILPDPQSGAFIAYHPMIETMRRTDKDACDACKGKDENCWHCGGTGIDPSK